MMDKGAPKCKPSSSGFTLIEALIAVLVLSLGLLGVAAMQLKAMQSAHVAYQRSVASLAAQDAVERLWVSLSIANGTCPGDSALNGIPGLDDWGEVWRTHLGEGLDESPVTASGCEYTIAVDWQDERFGGEEVSSLVYMIRLPGE